MKIQRTVSTDQPIDKVFTYLSDFTNTTDWDPGTVSTEVESGDGGVGTRYHNVSQFMGRKTELTYTVTDFVPNEMISLRGENKTVTAQDTMTFRALPSGTEVTYVADFAFSGVAKVVSPLLGPAFKKLGDEAEKGLNTSLAALL